MCMCDVNAGGGGSLNNKTSFREREGLWLAEKRERRKRLARRPGRCNLICAIFTGIFVAKPRGLFSGIFKFKTSLVAYPGTRTLFGDRTRRGLHAIHSFISALRGRWQFLARFFTTWPVCRFFFISFFPPVFFPPVVSLVARRANWINEKGKSVVSPELFTTIFTDHVAKHSFRFAHYSSVIPHRFISGCYFALSFSSHIRTSKETPRECLLCPFFGVSHITPSCYEISRRNYKTVYRIDFSRSKKSCGDEVIQVKIYI